MTKTKNKKSVFSKKNKKRSVSKRFERLLNLLENISSSLIVGSIIPWIIDKAYFEDCLKIFLIGYCIGGIVILSTPNENE